MRANGLASICIVSLFLPAQESAAFDFTWTIGANATFCEPWMFVGGANIDGPPWYLWDEVTGQYIHINQTSSDWGGTNDYVFKGAPNWTDMRKGGSLNFSGFPQGRIHVWPQMIWRRQSDHKWFMMLHHEYAFGGYSGHDHLVKTLLGSCSDNNLVNWSYEGVLGIAPYSGGQPQTDGVMDGQFFDNPQDTFYYCFYHHYFDSPTHRGGIYVMRAPKTNFGPGQWKKWYNGGWTQSAADSTQARETAIIGNESSTYYSVPSVSWNTYLNRYLLVFNDNDPSNADMKGMMITHGASLTSGWATPEKLFNNTTDWYRTLPGVNSRNGHDSHSQTGQNCRIIYGSGGGVWYRTVTFALANTAVLPRDGTIAGQMTIAAGDRLLFVYIGGTGPHSLKIMDATGALVGSHSATGPRTYELNPASMSRGVYVIDVTVEGSKVHRRLIVR